MSTKVAHRITKTIGYTLGIIIVWVPWSGLYYLIIVDPPLGWSLWTLWFVLARNRELNRAATAYFNPLLLFNPDRTNNGFGCSPAGNEKCQSSQHSLTNL